MNFFICKIYIGNDLLDHINNIKALEDLLVWMYLWCWYKFAQEYSNFIWTLDYHFEDHANEGVGYGVYNDIYDTQDVQDKRQKTPMSWYHNGVVSK